MKRFTGLRLFAIFLMLALLPPTAHGATNVWDGSVSTSLTCKDPEDAVNAPGTEKNPWLITSGADLKYLQQTRALWNSDVYLLQTEDIDMDHRSLEGMIGIGNANDLSNSLATAFKANYDGDAHKIRNLVVNWSIIDTNMNLCFGLFGFVYGGTIRNLTLISPLVTRDESSQEAPNTVDPKIGCLIGAIGANGSVVENVAIVKGRITDGGYNANARTYFVGGLIGDMSAQFQSTANITTSYGNLTIANVAVDCDVDMAASQRSAAVVTNSSHYTQFNIGGILGRARRPRQAVLPVNTFYQGSVKAPGASISPTVGMARGNGDTTKKKYYLVRAYAGEVLNSNSQSTSGNDDYYVLNGENVTDNNGNPQSGYRNPDENHYYGCYRIWDYSNDDYVNIGKKGLSDENAFHVRTLDSPNPILTKSSSATFDPVSPESWRFVQGVNHGSYSATTDDGTCDSEVLNMFNEYAGSHGLSPWYYSSTHGTYLPGVEKARLMATRTGLFTFTASTENVPAGTPLKYRWQLRTTETGEYMSGTETETPTFTITSQNPDDYKWLKVTLLDQDGEPYGSEEVMTEIQVVPWKYCGTLRVDRETLSEDRFKYVASFYDIDGTLFMGGDGDLRADGFSWVWEVSSDPTNALSWEGTDITTGQNWIAPYRDDRYYRVSLVYNATSAVMARELRGPRNMIFVYNADMTALGRDLNFTDFTGIDRSVVAETTYYPDGDDRNNGHSPYSAVRTMEQAYRIADADVAMSENIIVVMGYQCDPDFLKADHVSRYRKNVTITGNPTGLLMGGALNLSVYGSDANIRILGGHTTIEKINLVGLKDVPSYVDGVAKNPGKSNLFLYCELHDLTIGEGVHIMSYNILAKSSGQITGAVAPSITIVGGYHNRNTNDPIIYPAGNSTEGVTTLTFNSGCWGRIIGGSRNSTLNTESCNVYGSPETPHKVTVNIAISHPANLGAKEYADVTNYKYDIGLVAGGQTDGTIYGDCVININAGSVGRILTGNISYGRFAGPSRPCDSFFGSCEVTLLGGAVEELYGGTLGRFDNGSGTEFSESCQAYFYGRSIINVEGGTITSNLYGAGAGGVTGIGKCYHEEHHGHHTSDTLIPYINSTTGALEYGDYYTVRANGKMPVMTLRDGSALDFEDSYCRINIYGGTVKGNVYGGGHGFSQQITDYTKALTQAGDLFGDASVTMQAKYSQPPVVEGNIYGGGAGSKEFYNMMVTALVEEGMAQAEAEAQAKTRFADLARIFGHVRVELLGGTVKGNVYGGSMGLGGFEDMATIFGNTHVIVDGATVNGNIFGGCAFANIKSSETNPELDGSTHVEIRSGVIGNNIFGGSEGSDDYTSLIQGSTEVRILGGSYLTDPEPYSYKNPLTKLTSMVERTFNTYGGCYHNGTIEGSTSVYIEKSLLESAASIAPVESTSPATDEEKYNDAINDVAYRRFCVYGGGYGERTLVCRDARVHINIVGDLTGGVLMPTADFPTALVPDQTFFDVAGGGYNGEVGQWGAMREGKFVPVSQIDSPQPSDYEVYSGGDVYVTVEGSPFIRKIVGGGFYASVNNAETWLKSGTIKAAYGGGLLGYVHNNARMSVGSHARMEGEEVTQRFTSEPDVAATDNSKLFITGNVYGGNDVKGIVGTIPYIDEETGQVASEDADEGPLFAADVAQDTHKGVMLNIHGGTIAGDVYGAGNGHYRGYYVPEWTRYNHGGARHYREVLTNKISEELDEDGNPVNRRVDAGGNVYYVGRAYRSRPMTGSVKLNIAGNSEGDRVTIKGNVYGGGRSCTIGQWNTLLPFEDPRRLEKGGYLQLNIGSHVTVDNDVYLGAQGANYNTENTVPPAVAPYLTPGNHYGDNYTELEALGIVAYDHWWWNSANSRYEPGFPQPGQVEGNYGYTGEHAFRGYMKNIEMNGDVELTFYDDLYERTPSGALVIDAEGNPIRKTWVPGELALKVYDSSDVSVNSFYLGGKCGSMSNNRVMRYDYDNKRPVDVDDPSAPTSEDVEEWGSIYRVTIPEGVTLHERIVAGADNATVVDYPYNSDFTAVVKKTPEGKDNATSTFIGGIVTQCIYSYDHIVYNDRQDTYSRDVDPSVFMLQPTDPSYMSHTLLHGPDAGTTIYRYTGPDGGSPLLGNADILTTPYGQQRYSLAVTKEGDALARGYIGKREDRDTQEGKTFGKTAVKMTLANTFVLRSDDESIADNDPDLPKHLYGGLIYGGCYNSGNTMGHVIINVGCNLLGPRVAALSDANFGEHSGLRYNLGRVFGGGFGENTLVDGNTYINLLHNFKGMNVFGGGCRGDVSGSTNIVYLGTEQGSYIYGAIYGGGLQGSVGTLDETRRATTVNLYSGNVDKVYGGSCMGDIHGGTFVELCDQVTQEIDHLEYDRLLKNMGWDPWAGSRLIAGSVYGGNDVAGTINVPASATGDYAWETTVRIYEVQGDIPAAASTGEGESEGAESSAGEGPGKTSPGSDNGYNGFPLVGNLYGGSNGNYGRGHDPDAYTNGSLWFATGVGTEALELQLGGVMGEYEAFEIPHVARTRVVLNGGTVINAYGGGNQATVTSRARIEAGYDPGSEPATEPANPGNRHARAGFKDSDELRRVWSTLHLSSEEQMAEVGQTDPESGTFIFDYQVFRLFGGNENADMAIQPEWDLQCAYVGSLYSGGNFGRMTCYNPTPGVGENHGLTLTIDSQNLHANAVYGGGRVGDVIARPLLTDPSATMPDGFYGATLEIRNGVIDHVYGGNDVSGVVHKGTHVNIHGAISGDVYCAGNGNYRYFYDPTYAEGSPIEELYDDNIGGRYFRLPRRDGFGGADPKAAQKLLAINAYRPNVDKAWLHISGDAETETMAYVRGNVYCGGNSATIIGETLGAGNDDVRFTIGDYVTLNGVFLGSNGYDLVDGSMLYVTEQLNGIDLTKANELTEAEALATEDDYDAADKSLYPTLLDLYMRAVDVNGVPHGFDLGNDFSEAYIGDFYLGGNRGSMLTSSTITLEFPETLVIYGKIVGGSDNANLTYKGTTHTGGLTRPLATPMGEEPVTDKVHLIIKNRFEPWRLTYPIDSDERRIAMVTEPETDEKSGLLCFPDRTCNVYGGCYASGLTVGNIRVDLYSDMTGEYTAGSAISEALRVKGIGSGDGLVSKRRAIVNGISTENSGTRRTFAVIGGGYGAGSEVHGDISVRMLPLPGTARPTAAALFGGMQEGTLVGNTHVELRDGQVLTNVYGGSEAAPMYGSTQVIVGYPDYYTCTTAGEYALKRTDTISKAAIGDWVNNNGYDTPVIKRKIGLRKGDIISRRVYEAIVGANAASASCFTLQESELPSDYNAALSWEDVDIAVGDPASKTDPTAEYYAHGNIYGGGFISFGSSTTMAGSNSVCSFTDDHCLDPADVGLAGNSTILIWDNKRNADRAGVVSDGETDSNGAPVRDHIDIGTACYVEAAVSEGTDVKGKWRYLPSIKRFEHSPSHKLTAEDIAEGTTYYDIKSDGGIYGGGRKVFVENFRDVDIAYYGYAQGSPQYPKLINTAQRMDLLTFTDCCVHLQGANDFATNSVEAASYSLTRVDELQMRSSLAENLPYDKGNVETSGGFNTRHTTPRTRNYLAFYKDVHYVGAVTSGTPFTATYHDEEGQPVTTESYLSHKAAQVEEYYSKINSGLSDVERATLEQTFNRRNVGTAANMIGINNGYVLTVQSARMKKQGTETVDELYYGPVTGVFEVKLLTLADGEGGGYIFGLNAHDDPRSFMEGTGNFVFPGAAYNVSDAASRKYNYIRDDCFPVGKGWDKYWNWTATSTYTDGLASDTSGAEHGDCNALQDCHYWYVTGTKYFYNVTLTAFTSNVDKDFNIDNNSGIIYLYGVEPGAKLKVEEVVWTPSPNTEPDLTYTDPGAEAAGLDYRFYLTVDKNPGLLRTPQTDPSATPGDWYVTGIPRADYSGETGLTADASAFITAADDAVNNNFSGTDNVPEVGITLRDHNNDNTGRDYYNSHLSKDENVSIVLSTGEGVQKFTYTINLTVRYLLGPTISGVPAIENCALPGEYIYANSFGVAVDLDDDNMAVNGRNWYIAAPSNLTDDGHGNLVITQEVAKDIVNQLKGLPHIEDHVAEAVNDHKFDNDRQIHIPAYLYRDDWRLIYEVVINGEPFYVLPDELLSGSAEENNPYEKRLIVHNYHRMRPYDGTSILTDSDGHPIDENGDPVDAGNYVEKLEDLRLIAGSRIYIEDDRDMEYFFTWLRKLQAPSSRTTADGREIDPQYGEGLHVYLMANVTMPDNAGGDALIFRGTFHGTGHSIKMGENVTFLGRNEGKFYDTGFISDYDDEGDPEDLAVFAANPLGGLIENCFFYNSAYIGKGTLIRGSATGKGDVVNSFETDYEDSDTGYGLRMANYEEFASGEVAFNLNRFYLKKRYNLAMDEEDGELLAPLKHNYNDGEYRYARWSAGGDAVALRTAESPNYHDYRGIRINNTEASATAITGCDATFHNTDDPNDLSRYDGATGLHEPLYPQDYIFFGQDLSQAPATAAGVPQSINESARVYRASGYFGTTPDLGFHFNESCLAYHSGLTAIDFAGYRDRRLGNSYYVEDKANEDADHREQQPGVYYPPMLDLPERLTSFATTDNVTRNLLVYAPEDAAGAPALRDALSVLNYTRDTPEASIHGHLITSHLPAEPAAAVTDAHRADTRLLHLIDKHDFHCPEAFEVTDTVWYRREPDAFASAVGNAWEGLCLPFTARAVWGTIAERDGLLPNPMRNRGELTHFYGPEDRTGYYRLVDGEFVAVEGYENEAPSHEYWLRKFIAVSEEKGELHAHFCRPEGKEEQLRNAGTPYKTREVKKDSYHYSNPAFSVVYGADYVSDDVRLRPCYTEAGADYRDYPLVSAGLPYLVAFPGSRFYEFDMSGKFYSDHFPGTPEIPQVVTFGTVGAAQGGTETVIPMTGDDELTAVAHDSYTFAGTFTKRVITQPGEAALREGDGNSRFVTPGAGHTAEVLPFRTYMKRPTGSSAPLVVTGAGSSPGEEILEPEPQEPQEPELTEPDAEPLLRIAVEDGVLVIDSPWETDITLYSITGMAVRTLHVTPGVNRYPEIPGGYYVALSTKVCLR